MNSKNTFECNRLFNESSIILLRDQFINKRLSVNLIKKIQGKFGETYMCLNSKYNIKFFCNCQLRGYINKMVSNLESNECFYFKNNQLDDILKFQIVSISDNRVNIEFIKNKKEYTKNIIPLSDDEKPEKNKNISHVLKNVENLTVHKKQAKLINYDSD